tara:strand:- start:345 stop:932 length:588 start_codon:yes stop_codon:yes gene_type:complete
MALPIIISIAGVLVRTTASHLPKLLGRFKNARQLKKPTQKQIDEAKRLDSDYSNFGKGDKKILLKKDSKHPSFFEKLTGRGITSGQGKIGNVGQQTGMAAREKFKLAGRTVTLGSVIGLGGYVKLKENEKKRIEAAKTRQEYETLVRLVVSEQKQKQKLAEEKAKKKVKVPPKKPKEIDKIGAVRKPLRKPKSMK